MIFREHMFLVFGTLTAVFAVFFNVALAFLMLELKNIANPTQGIDVVQVPISIIVMLVVWTGLFAGAYSTQLRWTVNAVMICECRISDFISTAFFRPYSFVSFLFYFGSLALTVPMLLDLYPKLAMTTSIYVWWLALGILVIWQVTLVTIAIHEALSKAGPVA